MATIRLVFNSENSTIKCRVSETPSSSRRASRTCVREEWRESARIGALAPRIVRIVHLLSYTYCIRAQNADWMDRIGELVGRFKFLR